MRLRRTAVTAAALILSTSFLASCSGPEEQGSPPTKEGTAVSVPAQDDGQGQTAEDGASGGSPGQDANGDPLPGIGAGDPMLGVTDGVDRPELDQIGTPDLESTNALEQAEKFRRHLAGDASGDEWFAQMQEVADPSFAASLQVSDRELLRDYAKAAGSVKVSSPYVIGMSNSPYASVSGLNGEGNEVWTLRMSFHASKADPSIGTWQAVSIDWPEGSEALKSNDLPFSEDTRGTVLTTAAFASSSLFTQEVGDNAESRAGLVARFFVAPEKAKSIEVPFPERNTRAVAGDPSGRYFVTPRGSKDIWVEINNTSHVVSPSGDPDPDEEPKQNVVYVKLAFSEGNWVAIDAQKEKP